MADVTSAGIALSGYGKTCRKDVLGDVLVPVVPGAPPGIADGLGQTVVADHVLHGEVFDHDHVMVTDETGRGPVQEVGGVSSEEKR